MSALTVIMPTYNAMPFVAEAVQSISEQTFQDFTLLIIDDGSTDGTANYLHGVRDARIQVVLSAHRGLGATLNHGLALCETELLARMDADDVSLPLRLERQIAFLRDHPDVGMVGTQFSYMAANGKRVPSPKLPCTHAAIVAGLLNQDLALVHASLIFRTALLRRVGGYQIAGVGEDWDVFLRMIECSQTANLAHVHYLWRLHPSNSCPSRLARHRLGIEYACLCAERRRDARSEPSYEDFAQSQGWLRSLGRSIDAYALGQYRLALCRIGEGRSAAGFLQLLWAAVCSPNRALARMHRIARAFFWRDRAPPSNPHERSRHS